MTEPNEPGGPDEPEKPVESPDPDESTEPDEPVEADEPNESVGSAEPAESPEPNEPAGTDRPSERTGRFLVTHADDGAAVLSAVADGQVHAVEGDPGLEAGDVVEATLAPAGPLSVTWRVVDVDERWHVPVERADLEPTRQAREAAADAEAGDLTRIERAGEGELHVVAVPPARTDEAAADVVGDEATRRRAARLGARRVEVRAAGGVVSVRYLPD